MEQGQAEATLTPATETPFDAEEILAPLRGSIEPTPLRPFYQAGLLVVALAMVLLPLLYIALIALVAFGVWYHATVNGEALFAGRRSSKGIVLLYFGPLVVGVIGILFMIKPLFAPRGRGSAPLSLRRQDQELLFVFVDNLARAVGAPAPKRIDVDPTINASASFRRGLLSMLGQDLVLTIGLPLAAGLNLRQLAGILAHEFGHFSQGAAMRLSYIIKSVNAWFARVVYERDAWDERLERWSRNAPHYAIQLILAVARFFVWLTRRILWVFLWTGHAISCFLSREMEYDADRHQCRLAGSETLKQIHERLQLLSMAMHGAMQDLGKSWEERRLGDDVIALVMANLEQVHAQPELVEKTLEAVYREETKPFDTHPSPRDRIESAARENAPGIFRLEVPATAVFNGFQRLSRAVSFAYYQELIGPEVSQQNLVPTVDLVKEQTGLGETFKVCRRYFQGTLTAELPVFLPAPLANDAEEKERIIASLKEARARMLEGRASDAAALERLFQAEDLRNRSQLGLALLKARVHFKPEALKLPGKKRDDLLQAQEAAAANSSQARGAVQEVLAAAQRRLLCALRLLGEPESAATLPVDTRTTPRGRAEELAVVVAALEPVWPKLLELKRNAVTLRVLATSLAENKDNKQLIEEIVSRSRWTAERLGQIASALESQPYPYSHAAGGVSVARFALESVPPGDDIGGVLAAAEGVTGKLEFLYYRAIAELAVLAEKVETALGMPPPAPPEKQG